MPASKIVSFTRNNNTDSRTNKKTHPLAFSSYNLPVRVLSKRYNSGTDEIFPNNEIVYEKNKL